MPKKQQDPRMDKLKKLAISPPRLTVLTDHALSTEDAYFDSFQLTYRLGPVYDMLRHPRMKTPLAIAIYGDWGTGKTSAMRWLDYMLRQWNEHGKGDEKLTVKTLWFYPWKYHTKEDVWRGLISEVILKSIDINQIDRQNLLVAGKQFGMFLGRSFLHAIAGLTLKASAPGDTAGAELDLSGLEKILEDYRSTTHPEKAYLNEFEDALQRWIESTLRKNSQRMVIFIDDLDRCMPAVSLEVLEALKLYLNIEDLVFVVGVHKEVVIDLVRKHYVDCGVDEHKCSNYLAKMFQVEIDLSPNYRQIDSFLDEQIKQIAYWEDELSDDDRKIFRSVILHLAAQNPREIKRLLNSALISGAGFLMLQEVEKQKKSEIEFNQALQFFFICRLTENHPAAKRISSGRADAFFRQWSQIVREHQDDEYFSPTISVSASYAQGLRKRREEPYGEVGWEDMVDDDGGFYGYMDMLPNPIFDDYLDLLNNPHLATLMRIEYPSDTTEMTIVMGQSLNTGTIHAAIARQLGKKTDELTSADYALVHRLSLRGPDIDDIGVLSRLGNMEHLGLFAISASDLSPVSELADLRVLRLNGTHVSDIAPLSELLNLKELSLKGTQVKDISPLSGLLHLEVLGLDYTRVLNISPLCELVNLKRLMLDGTRISELSALSRLSNLQLLGLDGTEVTDLSPLSGLGNLERLGLSGTAVSDLVPLSGLSNLRELYIRQTEVTDHQVEALQKALPNCAIYR